MTYSWYFGDASALSTLTSPSHNYTTTGPFSVTLTASLGTCSKDTVKIFNTLYLKPLAAFNVNAETCLNTSTVFTDVSTASNSTINTWSWNFGDAGVAASQSPSHTYATADTYSVTLQVTTDKGCTDDSIRSIVINPLPSASFTISNPRCETQAITITDASVANAGLITEWSWDFGDGNTSIRNDGLPFTHTYATAGIYTVTLKVKTDRVCYSIFATQQITIHNMPVPDFNFPASLCFPGTVAFTNSTIIADGTLSQMTYDWNFGDLNNSTLSAPTYDYSSAGQYNVTLTATSNNGCIKSITHPLSIYGTPLAGYLVNNTGNICSNQSLNITNTSVVNGLGNVVGIEIYWDYLVDPTNVTIDNSPVANGTYSHTYPVFGSPLTKVYHVLIRAKNESGCTDDYSLDVTVHAAPDVVFNSMTGICQEAPAFNLMAASNTTTLTGIGVYSGAGVSNGNLFTPVDAGVGSQLLTYTFTGDNGCVSSASSSIVVFPTPLLNLGPDRNVLEGNSITLTPVVISGSGLSYLWNPGTYLSSVSISNPVCTPTNDIEYLLKIISVDGCKNEDNIFIKVVKDFIVPNTFSPNGDGINDLWKIENLIYYPNHRLEIFNRNGQRLFELTNYNGEWDGTFKGKPLPSGTYYYIIDLDGARAPKKGYVTIIR
jgi:gliding motility-associated-like protein